MIILSYLRQILLLLKSDKFVQVDEFLAYFALILLLLTLLDGILGVSRVK